MAGFVNQGTGLGAECSWTKTMLQLEKEETGQMFATHNYETSSQI